MKKLIVIGFLCVFLFGCDDESFDYQDFYFEGTVYSVAVASLNLDLWVNAEYGGLPAYNDSGYVDYELCENVANEVYRTTTYWHDKDIYSAWQTSSVTLDTGKGVCVDTATLIYATLRYFEIDDDNLKLIMFKDKPFTEGHLACCIVDEDGNYNYLYRGGFAGWNKSFQNMEPIAIADCWTPFYLGSVK